MCSLMPSPPSPSPTPHLRTLHLTLAYDGSHFHGWQFQPGLRTVEGVLRDAATHLLGECFNLAAASRTDAGVHARGQSVQLSTYSSLEADRIPRALNRYLPPDVAVITCRDVPPDFSVRQNLGKLYRYELWLAPYDDPLSRHLHWWYRFPLDIPAMQAAAPSLTGTRDFSGLLMTSRKPSEETVRTIHNVSISVNFPQVIIDISGKSFMYKQVRAMVGVLIAVGRGRIPVRSVPDVLEGKTSPRRFEVAPPHGLTLMQVFY